jgi:hypothetical protein
MYLFMSLEVFPIDESHLAIAAGVRMFFFRLMYELVLCTLSIVIEYLSAFTTRVATRLLRMPSPSLRGGIRGCIPRRPANQNLQLVVAEIRQVCPFGGVNIEFLVGPLRR